MAALDEVDELFGRLHRPSRHGNEALSLRLAEGIGARHAVIGEMAAEVDGIGAGRGDPVAELPRR